jgi:hypothetical protein
MERAVILANDGVLPKPLPPTGTEAVAVFPEHTTLRASERALPRTICCLERFHLGVGNIVARGVVLTIPLRDHIDATHALRQVGDTTKASEKQAESYGC